MMQAGMALTRQPADAVKESILAWEGDLHDNTLWKYTCKATHQLLDDTEITLAMKQIISINKFGN